MKLCNRSSNGSNSTFNESNAGSIKIYKFDRSNVTCIWDRKVACIGSPVPPTIEVIRALDAVRAIDSEMEGLTKPLPIR